jgi:hypothetical protein
MASNSRLDEYLSLRLGEIQRAEVWHAGAARSHTHTHTHTIHTIAELAHDHALKSSSAILR